MVITLNSIVLVRFVSVVDYEMRNLDVSKVLFGSMEGNGIEGMGF